MSTLTARGPKIPFRSQVIYPVPGPIYESDTGALSFLCTTYRQDSVKRVVPQGIEKLFNPTGRTCYRQGYTDVSWLEASKTSWASGASRDFVPIGLDWSAGVLSYEETNAALSALRAELKAQHVNLAQSLAEYRQTASMFSETAKEVVSLWRAAKLRKMPKGFRFTGLGLSLKRKDRAWADRWLKFQYGAMPLVADVQGSLRTLEQPRPALVTARHKIAVNKSVSRQARIQGSATVMKETTITSSETTTFRWKAYGEVNNPVVGAFTSLGFTNPFSLAYELLPYSFVLDWFINLGEVLADFDSLAGYRRVSCTQSQHTEYRSTNGLGGEYFYERWARGPFAITAPVSLQWKPSLSWKRVVSAVALVRQVAH